MTLREYAEKFIGRPYIWGGDGSGVKHNGFDCSGFVLECLWAFGIYSGKDTTAQGLYNWAKENLADGADYKHHEGGVMFFGKDSSSVTHVALVFGDQILEAGGGGQYCTTADNSTGFVRYRPIGWRTNVVGKFCF